MTFRVSVSMAVLAAVLGACAAAPAAQVGPLAADQAVGRGIDDVMAADGPPNQQWDLPDGRRAYQWQETSVTARVGAAAADGEVMGAASQTTCYYTLYARPDAKGRFLVVGYEPPRPGCMKFAMNSAGRVQ
jgi:hypothetical protein